MIHQKQKRNNLPLCFCGIELSSWNIFMSFSSSFKKSRRIKNDTFIPKLNI